MADLLNAVAQGKEPGCSGRDNLGTMAIIEAGYRSIRERRLVNIADAEHEIQHAAKALVAQQK